MVMMSTMMLTATISTLTQSWPACEVPGRPATKSHTAVSFVFCRRPTTSERLWSGAALRPLHRWLFICSVVCWLHVLFGNQLFMAYPSGAKYSERNISLKNPGSFSGMSNINLPQTPAALWFAAWNLLFLGNRALQTHAWYLHKFGGEYPPRRKAFIPYILWSKDWNSMLKNSSCDII